MNFLATIAEADAEYARNVGAARPQAAWILSDRDVWYRNPAYTGPAVRHPEDDRGEDEFDELEQAWAREQGSPFVGPLQQFSFVDDDIPF